MFCLYNILYTHQCNNNKGPTDDEIKVAAGRRIMNAKAANAWLVELKKTTTRLADTFNKQMQKAQVYLMLVFCTDHSNIYFRSCSLTRKSLRDC